MSLARQRAQMLIRTAALLLALVLTCVPAPAGAQQEPARNAQAYLGVGLGTTKIHDQGTTVAGGAALLSLGHRVAFGGAGWVMLGRSTVNGRDAASHYDLRVAWGGLIGQTRLLGDRSRALDLRALVGAGNGKVTLPLVNTLIASDNFGVLEPELLGTVRLHPLLYIEGGLSWRWVFGVQDLPGVSSRDLQGFSARLGIAIRNF